MPGRLGLSCFSNSLSRLPGRWVTIFTSGNHLKTGQWCPDWFKLKQIPVARPLRAFPAFASQRLADRFLPPSLRNEPRAGRNSSCRGH
jgi:hypothetical protein